MNVIENILKIMEIKHITAYQLEKEAGIKTSTFGSWKKGSQPPADKLIAICRYIGVTPNEIFGYETPISLTENEIEMLDLFRKLPEREQIKFIGRIEDKVTQFIKD